jgi:hypothetical protein
MKTRLLVALFSILAAQGALAATQIKQGPLTLFIDRADPQPRCPNCVNVTLLVDQPIAAGSTVISDIQAEIQSTNAPANKAAFIDFEKTGSEGDSDIYKATVEVPSQLSRETESLSLVVTAWGLRCLNFARLDCGFLKEKAVLKAKTSAVLRLQAR